MMRLQIVKIRRGASVAFFGKRIDASLVCARSADILRVVAAGSACAANRHCRFARGELFRFERRRSRVAPTRLSLTHEKSLQARREVMAPPR